MSHRAAQSHHKTQKKSREASRGEQGHGAEECTRRANNSSGIFLLAALSSGFGGVAGSGMRSGQSWSCSHNLLLLLFRASFSPKLARVPAAAPALCQLPSRAALERDQGSRCLPMEASCQSLFPGLNSSQQKAAGKGEGFSPLCCCPVASRS